jgi:hypothetical protein
VSAEFRILGPLDALVDGRAVALGGRHQRAVLALLVVRANEVVPVDRLIDGIWDDAPPESAANVLQGHVSQSGAAVPRSPRTPARRRSSSGADCAREGWPRDPATRGSPGRSPPRARDQPAYGGVERCLSAGLTRVGGQPA